MFIGHSLQRKSRAWQNSDYQGAHYPSGSTGERPCITVERDYVLAHVIAGVAALEFDSGLVFKGGTALRLCHIEDYRYSADLDFSLVSGSIENSYDAITLALEGTSGSIQGLHLTDDEPPRIAYVGPLGRERIDQYRKRWEDELREHVPGEIPHFGEVERCVTRRLRRSGLL